MMDDNGIKIVMAKGGVCGCSVIIGIVNYL